MDPEGKVVAVTGAAGGIGGALVRALIDGGARTVVAADLDLAGVERLSEELGGSRVLARALDVTDERRRRRWWPRSRPAWPRSMCSSPTPDSPPERSQRRR